MSDKLKTIDMYAVERLFKAIVDVPINEQTDGIHLKYNPPPETQTKPGQPDLDGWIDWPKDK